jgi:type I restriction enzyme S subunit
MRRYDSYKDSGVEWIGEIPRGWISIPLKRIVYIGNGKDYKHIEVEEGGYPVLGTGGVFSRCSEYLHTGPSVLLGRKGTIDNPLFIEEPFWTSDTIYYTIINESRVLPKLLYHLVHQIPFHLFSYGSAIPSMSKTHYEEMRFPLPPLIEQHQIVSYLDRKTEQIDSLIEKTRRKIDLLKENRTSLINEAVTKGLNPHVEMKYSGVEWIGEIPSHWNFIPTKYFTFDKNGVQTGPFGTQLNTKDYVEDGVKVMNQKTLINEDYDIGEEYISHEKYKELKGFDVIGGDLIMGTRGSFGNGKRTTFGKVSIVPNGLGDCVLHPCLIRIRLKEEVVLKRYYYFYINDSTFFLDEIRNTSNSTTIEVIYGVTLKDIRLPIPPLHEQNEIVSYLDEHTQLIDKTVSVEERRIELLKAYRQALISEVVTGKRKVTTDE